MQPRLGSEASDGVCCEGNLGIWGSLSFSLPLQGLVSGIDVIMLQGSECGGPGFGAEVNGICGSQLCVPRAWPDSKDSSTPSLCRKPTYI